MYSEEEQSIGVPRCKSTSALSLVTNALTYAGSLIRHPVTPSKPIL